MEDLRKKVEEAKKQALARQEELRWLYDQLVQFDGVAVFLFEGMLEFWTKDMRVQVWPIGKDKLAVRAMPLATISVAGRQVAIWVETDPIYKDFLTFRRDDSLLEEIFGFAGCAQSVIDALAECYAFPIEWHEVSPDGEVPGD